MIKRPWRRTGAIIKCVVCGKDFYVRLYRIKMGVVKYCSKKCFTKIPPKGFGFKESQKHSEKSKIKMALGRFTTGIVRRPDGYFTVYSPNHPFRTKQKRVFNHRLVMEKKLGRYLEPTEAVHHINGIKGDDRIENLMLFKSHGLHVAFHAEK